MRLATPGFGDAGVVALLVALVAGCGSAHVRIDAGTDGNPQDVGSDTRDVPADLTSDQAPDVAPEAGADAADTGGGDADDGGRDAPSDATPQVAIWDQSLWDESVWGN